MVGLAYQPAGGTISSMCAAAVWESRLTRDAASGYNPDSGVDPLSDADICLRGLFPVLFVDALMAGLC